MKQYTKNISIVRNDRKLKELWSWIKIADHIAAKQKVGNTDYSFHGVYGIWMASQNRNNKSPSHTPRTSSPKLQRYNTSRAKEATSIDNSNNGSTEDNLKIVDTVKLLQRQLALSACGFASDTKGFERELIE